MRRTSWVGISLAAAILFAGVSRSYGQIPGGGGGLPGRSQTNQPGEQIETTPHEDKPDVAARKAYLAGIKSMDRAKEFEEVAGQATTADKKARALDKVSDAYNKALDQFTEALGNKSDMYDAWNRVGYVHLRLGAFGEAIDDYNHALAIKPDTQEALFHRGEAYLAIDRLDEAKGAYIDLASHSPEMAGQLMAAMKRWVAAHQAEAHGMSPKDIAALDQWIQAHSGATN
jgi:tetratricopeptide (TPR) repeat protein